MSVWRAMLNSLRCFFFYFQIHFSRLLQFSFQRNRTGYLCSHSCRGCGVWQMKQQHKKLDDNLINESINEFINGWIKYGNTMYHTTKTVYFQAKWHLAGRRRQRRRRRLLMHSTDLDIFIFIWTCNKRERKRGRERNKTSEFRRMRHDNSRFTSFDSDAAIVLALQISRSCLVSLETKNVFMIVCISRGLRSVFCLVIMRQRSLLLGSVLESVEMLEFLMRK